MATANSSGETLTRSDLVSKIADSSGLPQSQVESVVRAYEGAIKDALAQGNEVSISDLGKFSVSYKAANPNGRNPATGETMAYPERWTPKFKPGKAFKDVVNEAGGKKKTGAKAAAKPTAKPAAKPAAKAAAKAAAKPAAKPAAKAAAKPAAKPAAKAAAKPAAKGKK